MTFHIGQKIKCVDASEKNYARWIPAGGLDGLQQDTIYRVRGVGDFEGYPCVWIEGITRPMKGRDPSEPGYHVGRFCAFTDISLFTQMLTAAPLTEPVE